MGADTLQAAKASPQILSTLVKAVPILEPFKSAVVGIQDAILQIITIVETAKGNMEDAKVLALYITDRTIRPLDLLCVTPATENRIHEFQKTLRQITGEITVLASGRSLEKWIFNYDRDALKLGALKQKVVDAVIGIQVKLRRARFIRSIVCSSLVIVTARDGCDYGLPSRSDESKTRLSAR
ncbi:hypothetical protein FRB94_010963 [Tulasnella sp. JGI-2019a]|nr:hypothetical protein FRB94_010963 [Tulasnella sp. JGI-2019a]